MIQVKVNKIKEFSFIKQFIQSPCFKEKYFQEIDLIVKSVFDIFQNGQKDLIFALADGTTSKLVELHKKGKINLDEKTMDKSFTIIWDAIRQ